MHNASHPVSLLTDWCRFLFADWWRCVPGLCYLHLWHSGGSQSQFLIYQHSAWTGGEPVWAAGTWHVRYGKSMSLLELCSKMPCFVHCMCGTIPVVLSLVSSTVQGVHQPVWTIGFSTAHVYGKWFLHLFNLLFVSAFPLFHSSILHYQNGCISTSSWHTTRSEF